MKELMEQWRRLVIEAEKEDETELIAVSGSLDGEVEEEPVEEWKKEDDHKYPSRKKRRAGKLAHKPDRSSWAHGADELVHGGLAKGSVGLGLVSLEEAKKPRKKQCHAYNPHHGKDGKFVDPEKEAGSYSMEKPDSNSPDDCTWGQARRSSANRSTQSTKRDCGRKGRYRCKDGSKKYEEALNEFESFVSDEVNEGKQEQFEAYLAGIISRELDRAIQKHMKSSGCSFQQLIKAMDLWSRSEKGSLFDKSKD
jgi:hypothetical protein